MDWNVRVVTKNNQIKDVKVCDYIYPQDAIDAAVAQTDAKSVVNYSLITKTSDYNNQSESNNESTYSSDSNDVDNNPFYQYLIVTIIPSVILWAISPVICCIFNSILFYWWFKK